jgi:nucleoid-associated protein YgaU
MARETKVGLLVGLAFIICFAIILANRGGRNGLSTELPYNLLVNREAASAATVSEPIPPVLEQPRSQPPATIERQRPASSSITYRAPVLTSGFSTPEPDSFGQPREPDARPARHASTRMRPEQRLEQLLEQRALAPGDESIPADPTAREDAEPEPVVASLSARQAPPALPEVSKGKTPRYVVQAGDTLSKIAAQQYGTRSRAVVEAIFQANRATLSSPDDLHVGDALLLPPVPGVAGPRLEQTESPGAEPSPSGRTKEPRPGDDAKRFRRYQVKERDRYASIAREQLGDERRWREIYELNKDKFPDPNLIRPGVNIKLPMLEVADSTGDGH